MKPLAILAIFLQLLGTASAQNPKLPFDSTLADSLGADKYGMKMYVLVILKTGPKQDMEKKLRDSLFAGHFANIGRLSEAGKLVLAGPLEKNDLAYRGIFILNVPTIAEAHALVNTDPAVKAGIFDMELLQWYGSAALPLYLKWHSAVTKTKF